MKHSTAGWSKFAALALFFVGCEGTIAEQPCTPNARVACVCPDGRQSTTTCSADGQSITACYCGAGPGTGATSAGGSVGGQSLSGNGGSVATGGAVAPASGGAGLLVPEGSGGTGGTSVSSDLPCDVASVIQANCSTCHGPVPKFGAPMSLVSAANFHAVGDMTTQTIGELVIARINDDAKPMPPTPNPRLEPDERAALTAWIRSGAVSSSCAEPGTGGSGGASTAGSGGASTAGAAGSATTLPDDVTCYRIVARNSAAGAKFSVPTTPDLYQCFDYEPPWGNKEVQIVSATPIIDNEQVLHHWILYNQSGAVNDGATSACSGAHPAAAMVTGWAPGGDPMNLPDDVGLQVETGGFTLEVHYNNRVGAGQVDASGAEVCVTDKLRPNVAAVHWLGTQNLNKIEASGTCTPVASEKVTILSSTPHMHLQGRHMKTVINRQGGGTEVLLDEPFDFNTQLSYETPAVINPGDTLTTTCTFASPTPFGQSTNDEMCYNFVLAYPAGGLAQFLQILRKYDCSGL